MNYIYDIVLNFQKNYYNFFEWNRTDNIKNIYKISIYHITDNDLTNLKYNKIKVTKEFINKIKQDNPKHKQISCLVSNGKNTIGILFNQEGILIKRSSLLFEEENEINIIAKTLPLTNIEYIKNIKKVPNNLLRIEIEKKEHIKKYLNNLNDESTLKYLYYEYFNKECEDNTIIKKILLEELENEWNTKKNNLYKIISLLIKNKLLSK